MSRPVKELHDRQSTVKHDGNGSISAIAMEMAGKLELGIFSLLHFSYFCFYTLPIETGKPMIPAQIQILKNYRRS